MAEDYYKLLGVAKSASDDEIKKAYRKLAMKYHPDRTKGDKAAEDRFKKISEAYAVLSDKKKRQEYDTFGSEGFHQRFSQEDIFRGSNLDDFLRDLGFGWNDVFSSRGGRARFNYGGGPFGGGAQQQQAQIKGSDVVYEMPLTLREIATGTSKTVTLQHQGQSERINVRIPKGMLSGKKLRLSGKGNPSPYGGPAGDLFIQAKVLNDPVFSAEGQDLFINREIKISEALAGTTLSVPTLDDKQLSLKIPPGTKHGTKMRLSGHGLPAMKGGAQGHLYVRILIAIPKKLSAAQKELIEQLREAGL